MLAFTEGDDHGRRLKMANRMLLRDDTIKHILTVDANGFHDNISTLHEGREYRLKQTVQRIRDSFESGDVDILRWEQGCANIANAVTKRNMNKHRLQNRIIRAGTVALPKHRCFA